MGDGASPAYLPSPPASHSGFLAGILGDVGLLRPLLRPVLSLLREGAAQRPALPAPPSCAPRKLTHACQAKGAAQRAVGSSRPEDMPFGVSLLSAAAAGGAASFVTNPLDMVKLRLQVQRASRAATQAAGPTAAAPPPEDGLGFHYRGMVDGLRSVLRFVVKGGGNGECAGGCRAHCPPAGVKGPRVYFAAPGHESCSTPRPPQSAWQCSSA